MIKSKENTGLKYLGTVIWFKNQFGFLSWQKDHQKQSDIFVHYSDIKISGFKRLYPGQKVSFLIGKNHNGQPKATEVEICSSPAEVIELEK